MVEEQARAVVDAPWPDGAQADLAHANEPRQAHVEVLDPSIRRAGKARHCD